MNSRDYEHVIAILEKAIQEPNKVIANGAILCALSTLGQGRKLRILAEYDYTQDKLLTQQPSSVTINK
jgi:hypothetical protein